MPFPKKWVPVFSFLTVWVIVWFFKPWFPIPTLNFEYSASTWYSETLPPTPNTSPGALKEEPLAEGQRKALEEQNKHGNSRPVGGNPYESGVPKPVGSTYTKFIVLPQLKADDTNWLNEAFENDPNINWARYIVDDMEATYHPPKNKGHEVMVYLSYIIDHYHNLSDVTIFMHGHRFAWHNNELLDGDAVQMISRLSSERVYREGFVNMRCDWEPGCPDWMHPGTVEEDINKQEEVMLAKSWSEIFPMDPIPRVLAQPCCAQFAISRSRIEALPLARYVFYRDWMLRTALSDYLSGRVWEYIW